MSRSNAGSKTASRDSCRASATAVWLTSSEVRAKVQPLDEIGECGAGQSFAQKVFDGFDVVTRGALKMLDPARGREIKIYAQASASLVLHSRSEGA